MSKVGGETEEMQTKIFKMQIDSGNYLGSKDRWVFLQRQTETRFEFFWGKGSQTHKEESTKPDCQNFRSHWLCSCVFGTSKDWHSDFVVTGFKLGWRAATHWKTGVGNVVQGNGRFELHILSKMSYTTRCNWEAYDMHILWCIWDGIRRLCLSWKEDGWWQAWGIFCHCQIMSGSAQRT